jgi:hypothetical protein
MRAHKRRLMLAASSLPARMERTFRTALREPMQMDRWREAMRPHVRRALRQPLPQRLRAILASA